MEPDFPSRIRSSGTFRGQEGCCGVASRVVYTYCILCSARINEEGRERDRDLSFLGDPFLPTPLDRLKIQHLAIFAESPSRLESVSFAPIPTT